MVHFSISPNLMDKLAAQAVIHGHSMSEEITRRLELSLNVTEPLEPKEYR